MFGIRSLGDPVFFFRFHGGSLSACLIQISGLAFLSMDLSTVLLSSGPGSILIGWMIEYRFLGLTRGEGSRGLQLLLEKE